MLYFYYLLHLQLNIYNHSLTFIVSCFVHALNNCSFVTCLSLACVRVCAYLNDDSDDDDASMACGFNGPEEITT